MNANMKRLLDNLIPFLVLGVAIALVVSLIVMFSYVLIWGLIIGAILWLLFVIKDYFFPEKQKKKPHGRIIDHKEND